jgi:hypothetical protein
VLHVLPAGSAAEEEVLTFEEDLARDVKRLRPVVTVALWHVDCPSSGPEDP